ncbi:MAG: NusA-like transcription termination signal-binding factor [Candidatus Woesearchaeota archaeon]
MERIKFDFKLIKLISLFENMTHAKVKDCIDTDNLTIFIVGQNEIGKAIGKNGINVRKIENKIKKKIKIIEYNPDMIKFIKNIIFPIKVKEVKIEDEGIVKIISSDLKSRGFLIGRNASILRSNENIIKRYFDINEIKVE